MKEFIYKEEALMKLSEFSLKLEVGQLQCTCTCMIYKNVKI